ncbi:DNA mismatch repair protein MutS [Muricoccus nepalensis]|uniref:DNA mismatch repair protein MutS n=1 Tax=Muricoccus nepalensis TaxID=1854500 RepID=UPI001386A5D5|nr:DNA mismatch repair protein MutS [Roseomonas nepalensis]
MGRLLSAGHKVALSEQPPSPGGDRPLQRLTPGTSVDAAVLAPGRTNNLAVAFTAGETVGFAWLDVSTGEGGTAMASVEGCGPALAQIAPTEVLVARWPETSDALAVALRSGGTRFGKLDRPELVGAAADGVLAAAYGPGAPDALRGFSPPELSALAALLDYVRATAGRLPEALPPPRRAAINDTMEIDAPTLRGLEVLASGASVEGTLLSVLDRTVTPAGARLLARQLAAPLTKPDTIRRRLAMVRFMVNNPPVRAGCREELSGLPDVLRAYGRLSLGKAGPRDLAAIRDGLERAQAVAAHLATGENLPVGLATAARELRVSDDGGKGALAGTLRRALVPSPPATIGEGGFVVEEYHVELDAERMEAAAAKEAIGKLQDRYVQQTGIKSLRIKTNTLIGYHVEVPAAAAKGLADGFTLRQGLASSARYTTTELDRLAAEQVGAAERVAAIEERVFRELVSAALAQRMAVTRIAHAAAALDLVCGLGQAAAEGLWVEPELADDTLLEIEGGRHPVAEQLLEAEGRSFVPNDCRIGSDDRLWLLTGPNMAGKSTFLRQVALVVLMAQVGSFVPATRARVGVVDKLFSRIGASDDLVAGRSTFMVEMLETAAILKQATARSLVILDEVGRGTSTHDGLAIAQASMEYLHDEVGCRTLFATHFHELADAAEAMPWAVCMAMDASPGRHDEMFAFKVRAGRAGQSYGLRVATHAGMPATVLRRAAELLGQVTGTKDHEEGTSG